MITCFIGTTELLLIGGLALLLFGGKKLPEMMRGLGKGMKEFKEGMKEPLSLDDNVMSSSEQSEEMAELDVKASSQPEKPGNE